MVPLVLDVLPKLSTRYQALDLILQVLPLVGSVAMISVVSVILRHVTPRSSALQVVNPLKGYYPFVGDKNLFSGLVELGVNML